MSSISKKTLFRLNGLNFRSMRQRIFIYFIFIMSALICKEGFTQDTLIFYKKPLVPNYINSQFAGNVGAMIIGAGYRMNRKRTLELVVAYGYTPKYEAAKRIHNFSLKGIFIPVEWDLGNGWYLYPQTGLGISRQFPKGNSTFITLPSTYPEGYYAPNALRIHFNLGGKLRREFGRERLIEAIEFYAETTTNDLYMYYYFKSKEIWLNNIFSMAIGVNFVIYNLKSPGIIKK